MEFDCSSRFLASGTTVGQVFGLAAAMEREFRACGVPGGGGICLATTERTLVASALLAAARGGFRLLVPHSLSARAVRDVAFQGGCLAAIADPLVDVPVGVRSVYSDARWRTFPVPDAATCEESSDVFLDLYTGGTTGQPKPWPKTPASLLGEARFLADRFGLGPGDVILSTVPPNHIYGLLFSVLLPLVSGARVVPETAYYPREVARFAREHSVTVLVSSPAHYKALAAWPDSPGEFLKAFSSGGFLDPVDADRLHQRTGAGVTEVYGSTESGGVASRCRQDGERYWTAFEPVEWSVAGGRLLVRSPFLSPGLPLDPEGWFVTGDRAIEGPAGTFELLGRADGIVKIAGNRVAVDGVCQRISRIRGVCDAHVLALPAGGSRENDLAALVVATMDESSLRHAMAEVLDPVEIPRHVRIVECIPRVPTGKVDREEALALFPELSGSLE